MNQDIRKRYQEHRKNQVPASTALYYAKQEEPFWTVEDQDETDEVDGFTVRVRIQPDEDADTSYLGTFDSKWSPDAIERPDAGRGDYKYFVPADSVDSIRTALSRLGWSRHAAYTQALKQRHDAWRRAEDYGNGWSSVVILVSVSKDGKELATDSLGGVESDSQRYLDETVSDMIRSCIEQAKTVWDESLEPEEPTLP